MKNVLMIIIFFLLIFLFWFFKQPYHYKNLSIALIGSDISEIDEKIGVKKIIYIEGKQFISYPYKKYKSGCGIGYSLTMHTKKRKVSSILNELSFYCNDRRLLSKTHIFRDEHTYINIFIWPFFSFEL